MRRDPRVVWAIGTLSVGDIMGTRKRCLGMVRRLLTDARKTSYLILSSLLTAECSTVELPGNRIGYLIVANYAACCSMEAFDS